MTTHENNVSILKSPNPQVLKHHGRRALGVINQSLVGVNVQHYPCAVNKRAITEEIAPNPMKRPLTRLDSPIPSSNRIDDYKINDVENSDVQLSPKQLVMPSQEVEMEDIFEDLVMDIDRCDAKDHLAVVEYVKDLYEHYRLMEMSHHSEPSVLGKRKARSASLVSQNEKIAEVIDWSLAQDFSDSDEIGDRYGYGRPMAPKEGQNPEPKGEENRQKPNHDPEKETNSHGHSTEIAELKEHIEMQEYVDAAWKSATDDQITTLWAQFKQECEARLSFKRECMKAIKDLKDSVALLQKKVETTVEKHDHLTKGLRGDNDSIHGHLWLMDRERDETKKKLLYFYRELDSLQVRLHHALPFLKYV